MVSPFLPADAKLRAVREAIPAVNAGIYLNTAMAGPLPAETAAAMAEIADHEVRFGRAHAADVDDAAERREEARAAIAALLAADVGSVALTRGSRDALAAAVAAVGLAPGDLLLTVRDPGADIDAVAVAAARRGSDVVRTDPPTEADDPAAWRPGPTDRPVRLVVLPHVTAAGRLLPIAEIARSLRASAPDVTIVVDGRLAVGALPVVVDELGVDAYAVAGDAWLLGPSATGGLWLASRTRERLDANGLGPDSTGRDSPGAARGPDPRAPGRTHAPDATAFEPGELPSVAVVGLARSAGWLSMYVGLDWVLSRPRELVAHVLERLSSMDGVDLLTPLEPAAHGPVVVFRVAGWSADDVVDELGRRVFAIAGTVGVAGGTAVRLSLACFNETAELDRVSDAIELLAAHTPDTLPRRTALTILGG